MTEEVVINMSPAPCEVEWSDFLLQFDGVTYEIAGGVTDKKYIWWDKDNPNVLQTTDSKDELESSMVTEDCIVGINHDGYHKQMIPTATLIHGGTIITDTITAAEIKAGSVTTEKLNVEYWYTEDLIFTDNSPSAGYVSWTTCSLYWKGFGVGYTIASGNTNKKYIWWEEGDADFSTSNTKPTLDDEDCLIAINIDGTAHPILNSTMIHGGSIKTGSVTADEIKAASITTREIIFDELTSDPTWKENGMLWFRTNLDQFRYQTEGGVHYIKHDTLESLNHINLVRGGIYSIYTPSFNTWYQNATTSDNLRLIAVRILADPGDAGEVYFDLSDDGGSTYDTHGAVVLKNSSSNGGYVHMTGVLGGIIPKDWYYRLRTVSSGTPTFGIDEEHRSELKTI